jgi:uncharacterized protein YbjT (DUF2867 family)
MSLFVVFGASGKLGMATVNELCACGGQVRAVLRDASKADRFRQLGCEVAIADLSNLETVLTAMRGADVFCQAKFPEFAT